MSDQHHQEIIEDSTTAENLAALKDLLSSKEAKEFVSTVVSQLAVLFGQTTGAKVLNLFTTVGIMAVAFTCIGVLGYLNLVTPGTTGTLAGMIIGYFFKRGA